MLDWLFPDERKFYTRFSGVAQQLTSAATLLEQGFDRPALWAGLSASIEKVDREAELAARDLGWRSKAMRSGRWLSPICSLPAGALSTCSAGRPFMTNLKKGPTPARTWQTSWKPSRSSTCRLLLGRYLVLTLLCASFGRAVAQSSNAPMGCGGDLHGEKRLQACRAEVVFEPRSVRARLEYGWALVEAQQYDKSLAEFEAALRLDPPNPEAQYGRAVSFEATGAREDAVKSYQVVLRNDERLLGALLGLARSLGELGRHQESVATARKVTAAAPDDPGGHYALAIGLLRLGKTEESIGSLKEAARLAPTDLTSNSSLVQPTSGSSASIRLSTLFRHPPDWIQLRQPIGALWG